jgi:aconitate hydratase
VFYNLNEGTFQKEFDMSHARPLRPLKSSLDTQSGKVSFFPINDIVRYGFPDPRRLPFSLKILLESAVRNCDNYQVTEEDVRKIASWTGRNLPLAGIAFKPGRVILQDFTGVPCVVDLAAMRSAMRHLGGDYRRINPQVPCDLVIDHSVQVDAFGSKGAFKKNVNKEFQRNKERYEFLKWGQNVFKNFRVIPPATGIVHQVNLEYLARGVLKKREGREIIVYPDSLVGTDSHTTMINGLGIVGWGVGGIEAEAVMLGEPIDMLMPEVIGMRLIGQLGEGVTATDLVLTVTQILRKRGVVSKFVEFFGEGLGFLSLPDRATISNMAPEYGATIGIFPIDEETLNYYKMTGRSPKEVDLVDRYMKEQGLFYNPQDPLPDYTDLLELDLGGIQPSLAGPKRPQDRVALKDLQQSFRRALQAPVQERGFGLSEKELAATAVIQGGKKIKISQGAVAIAAITSCTNTSNPSVLIAAALLAKKAVELGLQVPAYVKTSFAPGSQVVEEYLQSAGLLSYLEKLRFHIVGYGCTTCIGNSGPLPEEVAKAIQKTNLVAASVLSGNRNFEGRVNPDTRANYLASPPLVIAYALAGTVDINLDQCPLGTNSAGRAVYLRDIWPGQEEIRQVVRAHVTARAFRRRYKNVTTGNDNWNKVKSSDAPLYPWKSKSTYIQEPPFFIGMNKQPAAIQGLNGLRVLVMVGDSITTDHISPAGSIAVKSPAGQYLIAQGVDPQDFNSYGARRGNDRVMTRGTFANIRLRNQLAPGTEGSWTMCFPRNKIMTIYDAAEFYRNEGIPLMVLAGKEYGTGSSRDWAAKGAALLGVRVVLAESFERIHRSNLAGMGILPLEFKAGETRENLGLTGREVFDFSGIAERLNPRQDIGVTAKGPEGKVAAFTVTCRLDTPVEIDYFRNGGILQTVLRKLAGA